MAQIGDEARPVVEEPRVVLVGESPRLQIGADPVRVSFDLPAEAVGLDDSAFVLEVQRTLDAEADEIALGAALLHFVRVERGWRLRRDASAPGRVTVELSSRDFDAGSKAIVRLKAILPTRDTLQSVPFAVPERARLWLGYGALYPPRGEAGASSFVVTLACDGREPRRLLEDEIRGDEATAWRDAVLELPAAGSRCSLRLEQSGAAARLGGGVWAVPQVLARADGHDRRRPNVVLISLDTLRADHLSTYGYPRPTSPAIDAELAARGTVFADVSTTFPLTSAAHFSLFTAMQPDVLPQRGLLDPLVESRTPVRMLAEVLRDAGYATAAYTEDALLAGFFGFWFGFDTFVERPLVGEARGLQTFMDGARYLRRHREEQFFLFLHTYKVHSPYTSSPAYAGLFRDAADWSGPLADHGVPPEQRDKVDAYDRTIREVDDQLAGFLAELDRLGLADETYVVVLSDHGEAFGEHGVVGHGFGGHQEQLHIPLIVRGPGIPEGRRVQAPASIVDVVPTLLDLLQVPAAELQGRSLRATLTDAEAPDDERDLRFAWLAPGKGLRRGRWKLLDDGSSVLFDLRTDPRERDPLVDATVQTRLAAGLAAADADDERWRERIVTAGGTPKGTGPQERVVDSLRALGYLD